MPSKEAGSALSPTFACALTDIASWAGVPLEVDAASVHCAASAFWQSAAVHVASHPGYEAPLPTRLDASPVQSICPASASATVLAPLMALAARPSAARATSLDGGIAMPPDKCTRSSGSALHPNAASG